VVKNWAPVDKNWAQVVKNWAQTVKVEYVACFADFDCCENFKARADTHDGDMPDCAFCEQKTLDFLDGDPLVYVCAVYNKDVKWTCGNLGEGLPRKLTDEGQ